MTEIEKKEIIIIDYSSRMCHMQITPEMLEKLDRMLAETPKEYQLILECSDSVDFPKYNPQNSLTDSEKWLKIKEQKACRKMCKRGKR